MPKGDWIVAWALLVVAVWFGGTMYGRQVEGESWQRMTVRLPPGCQREVERIVGGVNAHEQSIRDDDRSRGGQ